MKRNLSLDAVLCPLRDKQSQAYLSNAIQVADLLEWILQQVGVSEVWQTSFSISEEFLRRLYFIEKSGTVSQFNLVLDHKATNKTLKLWAFITQVISHTFLADNHSKILLVRSEAGDTVSVVTTILGLRPEDLRFEISKQDSPVSQAYRRGKAASKVKLRTQEMQLAMVGSPLALATVQQNLMDMEDDE